MLKREIDKGGYGMGERILGMVKKEIGNDKRLGMAKGDIRNVELGNTGNGKDI
jgi:hypothetical protein